ATVSSTLSTVNMTLRRPSVFGGAIAGLISTSGGLRNFVSSSRPCPSGVRIMTMSTRTPSSPLMRSTHGPSIGLSPSRVMPSAVKKAIAAARSSTTTLTWSNLLIVMSLLYSRGRGICLSWRPAGHHLGSGARLGDEGQGDAGPGRAVLHAGQPIAVGTHVREVEAGPVIGHGEPDPSALLKCQLHPDLRCAAVAS